eukprot:COSAG04_NODE_21358_length_375_cov_0.750000_1_plen_81_part_10
MISATPDAALLQTRLLLQYIRARAREVKGSGREQLNETSAAAAAVVVATAAPGAVGSVVDAAGTDFEQLVSHFDSIDNSPE